MMALAARDHEFVADTAMYFPEPYADGFVDSGLNGVKRTTQVSSLISRPMMLCDESITDHSRWSSGSIAVRRAQPLAGAMLAASMALSPPAYASETRPKPHTANLICVATETQQSLQLKEAVKRVEHLARKVKGWKGPDSVPMTKSIQTAATDFLRGYFSKNIMLVPFIGLDSDGDVTLFWNTDDVRIDLSISENGRYSFYAETKNGASFEADDVLVSTPLPNELAALLQKHTI